MSRQDAHVQSQDIPTAESLIDQIDAEVRLATARVTGSGWTPSGILVVLLPVLWALVNELRTRWHEPSTIAYNWGILFLLLSLFFDALETFPHLRYRRFNDTDLRERLQWIQLFNFRVNMVDLIRYLILILMLFTVNFGIEWYIVTAATVFYVLRFILGSLFRFSAAWSPILIPFNRTLQYKFFTSYFLAWIGLIVGAGFLQALINSFNSISASDLLITGLIASSFYLLRVLFAHIITPYVMALEEVRHDLAVGDIDVATARQRLAFIKGGMLIFEAVEDYTSDLRLFLKNMCDELREALRVLDPLPEGTGDEGLTPSDAPASMEEQWTMHKTHLYNFRTYLKAFRKESKSRRFRLHNWLVRLYRKSYFLVLSIKTKRAIQASFAALRQDYEICLKLEEECADVRHRFAEKFTEVTGCKLKKERAKTVGATLRMPESLTKTEEALLKAPIR